MLGGSRCNAETKGSGVFSLQIQGQLRFPPLALSLMQDSAMKSKSTSSVPGRSASRRPSKLGDMLAKKKTDEARRLTPEQ